MDTLVHELRRHGENTLQLLQALDSNGDGWLTSHELRSSWWNMRVNIGTYDLDMAMRAFDVEQKGYVKRSEIVHCVSEYETLLEFRELYRVLKMHTDARAGKLASTSFWNILSIFDRHTVDRIDPAVTVFETGTARRFDALPCGCVRLTKLYSFVRVSWQVTVFVTTRMVWAQSSGFSR
jgi:Ca2+-binding EF-hand superfamily protein